MKQLMSLMALAAILVSALAVQGGVSAADKTPKKPAKTVAKAKPKLPAKAVCVVCAAKTGKKELEPVHSSLKYKGKTYYFCEEKEKAEFISNPAKYAK